MHWKKALLIVTGAGLVAVGLSIFLQTHSPSFDSLVSTITGASQPAAVTMTAAGSGSSYVPPGIPERLIIPSIGVNANIQEVGLFWDGDGTMGIPTNFTDVAWYDQGPRPGAPGAAVIDGHLDGRNTPRAVFYELGDLKPGDMVEVVDKNGATMEFAVTATSSLAYNASTTSVFTSDDSAAHLNFITCAGDWIPNQKEYNERLVVFTTFVTSTPPTATANSNA